MPTSNFKALMLKQDGERVFPEVQSLSSRDLPDGDVLVEVHYSSVNFKDAMALANKGIIRKFPMVPGIDFAGIVVESSSPAHRAGDQVILTGWGVGERHWGGYSQYARVKSEWLVPLPSGLTLKQAMEIGTAGFTAMLGVQALEHQGLDPAMGPVLVTGSSGGVGSVAVAILAHLGYQVWAMTGRPDQEARLRSLGATQVVSRQDYASSSKPGRPSMEQEVLAGAIDIVGGDVLAALIARMRYGGAIAACGLVGGTNVDTTVFPFILRGVSLLGIDSVRCPMAKRLSTWERIADALPIGKLESFSHEIKIEQVPAIAEQMLSGQGLGRTVVKVRDE
jgi:acrylyl-CoA reductase (NADPH)